MLRPYTLTLAVPPPRCVDRPYQIGNAELVLFERTGERWHYQPGDRDVVDRFVNMDDVDLAWHHKQHRPQRAGESTTWLSILTAESKRMSGHLRVAQQL